MSAAARTRKAALGIEILMQAEHWRGQPDAKQIVRRAVRAADAVAKYRGGARAVCVVLSDDGAVRALNRDWRGKDAPTNALSFPAIPQPDHPGVRPLGDIALAFETLAREAEGERKPLADHVAHLIVHGVLHLLGHDHETEAEAGEMEALEVEALARLGIADPYRELAA